MDEEFADAVLQEYDKLFKEFEEFYGARASSMAAKETKVRIRADRIEKARVKRLQAEAAKRRIDGQLNYRTAHGKKSPLTAALAQIDAEGLTPEIHPLMAKYQRISLGAYRKLNDALQQFGPGVRSNLAEIGERVAGRVTGTRPDLQATRRASLLNIVRELFGESSGDKAAAEMATAFKETFEWLRLRWNAAGGRIAYRHDFGSPTIHDSVAVRNAGLEEWINFTMPLLDFDRMLDGRTGRALTEPQIRKILSESTYDAITTEGMSKLKMEKVGKGKALYNQRLDHRFLVFKDADSWWTYQERFGNTDPFNLWVSHIERMSREVAAMEEFGPNPNAAVEQMIALAQRQIGPDKAGSVRTKMQNLWDQYTGVGNVPDNRAMARFWGGTRQWVLSSIIGRAIVSAFGDTAFTSMAARLAGIKLVKQHSDFLRQLFFKTKTDVQLQKRLGIVAESAVHMASSLARHHVDVFTPETMQRLADTVVRASGLNIWTETGRMVFEKNFYGLIAESAGQSFDALDPTFRSWLTRFRITPDEWDIIRKTELYDDRGALFFVPENLASRTDIDPKLADDLTTKITWMVEQTKNLAVPMSNLRARAFAVGGRETAPGTPWGEIRRSAFMLKSFSLNIIFHQLRELMTQVNPRTKAEMMAWMFLTTTLIGGLLVLPLKDVFAGKDPREINFDDPKFWLSAFAQGGGFGILGDFLFQDHSRYGHSIGITLGGPVLGLLDDIARTGFNGLKRLAGDEDVDIWKDVARMLRYTPGSNLWYHGLAFQRLVADQVELISGDKARKRFQRRERKLKREFGSDYWWAPGQVAPERRPQF